MNIILSNLGVEGKRYYDNSWNLPVKECSRLARKAEGLFSEGFIGHIETACDRDRAEGEWIKNFSWKETKNKLD